MKRFILLRFAIFALLLVASASLALAIRRERLIDSWRPLHYSVELTLDNNLKEIVSAATLVEIITVKKLSVVDFDFGELTTDKVTINSSPVPFVHKSGKLTVQLPQAVNANTRLRITIAYHGQPKDGLILTSDKDGRPSAVGDNWPDRVHHWIPCLDHPSAKATVTFKVTAPTPNLVVANGRFDQVETTSGGTRTWTFTEGQPIPPYCMIIGVGQFSKIDSPMAITPLSYYVAHSDAVYAPKGFAPSAPALKLFSETVGPYPYEKLSMIIGATRFGGMENSSAIVFSDSLFNPNPFAKLSGTFGIPTDTMEVVAHEIAHQWFGDSVTESTWSDLWLSEGFATYFAGLFVQRQDGEAAFLSYMKNGAQKVFAYEKSKRSPLFDTDTENLFDLLNANNYEKGSWVLHMLRSRLGDDAFFRGIRDYYDAHKHSTATTEDLRRALEKSSAMNLSSFFARWVYDSGHPKYKVRWKWSQARGALSVTLDQVQTGDAFLDPVPLVVTTATGKQEFVIKPSSKRSREVFRLGLKPTRLEIDPHYTLLREVREN